jgi:Ca2+-binding RTX toxin-like protein
LVGFGKISPAGEQPRRRWDVDRSMKTLGHRSLRGAALAALALLPLSILASPTPPAAAGETPTCQGQAATLVGTPGQLLNGTAVADVIVSNSASEVRGAGGDDLICVTGDSDSSDQPLIKDGSGDDVVDARLFEGALVRTDLGTGSDDYFGSPRRDSVSADGEAGDEDWIRTADGRDYVSAEDDGSWYLDIALGPRRDQVVLGASVTFDLDGGHGRDLLLADTCACESTVVRVGPQGTWVDDRQEATIPGFEEAGLSTDGGLTLSGTEGPDHLNVDGCGARIRGLGGDDSLVHYSFGTVGPCAPVRQQGGAGDDLLIGSERRDLLYGGLGHDTALGGDGHDLCRAEEEESCEE